MLEVFPQPVNRRYAAYKMSLMESLTLKQSSRCTLEDAQNDDDLL